MSNKRLVNAKERKDHKLKLIIKIALGLILVLLGLQYMYNANPLKKNAAIMLPFAEQYNLTKVHESNNPLGQENSGASFGYTFQSPQSLMQLASVTNLYLYANGYIVRNLYITRPCQPGQYVNCLKKNDKPYWSLIGSNNNKENVEAIITDLENHDKSQYEINNGKTILNIRFYH